MHSKIICILDDEEREALQKVADIECPINMTCNKCPLSRFDYCIRHLCAGILEKDEKIIYRL